MPEGPGSCCWLSVVSESRQPAVNDSCRSTLHVGEPRPSRGGVPPRSTGRVGAGARRHIGARRGRSGGKCPTLAHLRSLRSGSSSLVLFLSSDHWAVHQVARLRAQYLPISLQADLSPLVVMQAPMHYPSGAVASCDTCPGHSSRCSPRRVGPRGKPLTKVDGIVGAQGPGVFTDVEDRYCGLHSDLHNGVVVTGRALIGHLGPRLVARPSIRSSAPDLVLARVAAGGQGQLAEDRLQFSK
jgi:hypothetical protein